MLMRSDRPDLPHLSISFNNPSRIINFHLMSRLKDKDHNRIDIATISEDHLKDALQQLGQNIESIVNEIKLAVKPVRLNWLMRHKFRVFFIDESTENTFSDKIFPRRRKSSKWERYFDKESFDRFSSSEANKFLFRPSILHHLYTIKFKGEVFAIRRRSRFKHEIIPLVLGPGFDGQLKWLRIDGIAKVLENYSKDLFLLPFQNLLPSGTWDKIRDGMQLEELGFE